MDKKVKILAILFLLTCISFLTLRFSRAYFSDTEKTLGNSIQVGTWGTTITPTPTEVPPGAPTSTPTPIPTETPIPTNTPMPTPTSTPSASHLVINEVYPASDNKLEWVELYNPTDSAVNVSGWKIADKNAYDTGNDDTFPTVAPIPAGGYAVVITNQGVAGDVPAGVIIIQLTGANIGSGLNTDGDAVVLKNAGGTIIDAMNFGNISIFFSSPPAAPSVGSSLVRLPNGQDTDTAADWQTDSSLSKGSGN